MLDAELFKMSHNILNLNLHLRISKSLWTKSFSERLVILGLTTLEERRTRGDLIQMYKIAKGLDIVEREEYIEFRNIRRGHDLSFNREPFKSRNKNDLAHYVSIRHNFFTNRVFQIWNKLLPREVVNLPSLNSFKKNYDNFNLNRLIQH